jgi:hypothetical protein
MAKKRSAKKEVEEEKCCSMYGQHGCKVFLVKIASMAFLLFLLTVPRLGAWLQKVLLGVHWGIYLAIVLLLMIFAMTKYCKKK